jgi:hypothetical protein
MKKAVLLFIVCTAVWCPAVFADEAMPQFAISTARSNGMGGAHIAYTDNVFGLLVNPAAIMRVEQRSFFALSPTLFNPQSTFGLIGPISETAGGNTEALGDAADILSKQKGKVALGFDLREFPFSIAWVADGFGFGLWNRVFTNANIIGTNVELNVYADVILPVGFAFKILDTEAHSVDAGLTVKPFVRFMVRERLKILDMMGNSDIMDSLSAPFIAGAGFDIGFLYRWEAGLSAGLTLDDIATRGGVVTDPFDNENDTAYYVPFSMNLGLAYDLEIGRFWTAAPRFITDDMDFIFTFDWRNFTNVFQQSDYQKRNSSLDISLGLQITFINIINLRFGMNEMLPAFGLGADFGPIELDLAYYGRELGLEPGQLSAAALDLTFAVRPGAKKRNWPWTRKSLVELFTQSD